MKFRPSLGFLIVTVVVTVTGITAMSVMPDELPRML
jgi:hypothetical protein